MVPERLSGCHAVILHGLRWRQDLICISPLSWGRASPAQGCWQTAGRLSEDDVGLTPLADAQLLLRWLCTRCLWWGCLSQSYGGARAVVIITETENQLGRKKSPPCGKISEWVRIVLLLRTRCMLMVLPFLYSAGTNKILYVLIVILFFVALIGIVIFIVYYKNKGKKLTGTW